MLSKRLHTVWVLSCVGWQQCMPVLLLFPTYYTDSSSIPSPLPCCTPCQQFELHSHAVLETAKGHRLMAASTSPAKKTKFTIKDDLSEIFPPRIIPSSNYYMEIHDGTFPLIEASQKILPKPKGDPSDFFSTVLTLSYHIM